MTKVYFILFGIAIIWLIYKALTKSKNAKSWNRHNRAYGKPESMGDLANMFLFAELMNKKPQLPIKQHESSNTPTPKSTVAAPTRRRLAAKRKRLTKKQKSILFQRYGESCAICRVYLGDQQWNCIWDHIIPLAAAKFSDYSSEYLNRLDNFRPLCCRCSAYVTMKQQKQGLFRRI